MLEVIKFLKIWFYTILVVGAVIGGVGAMIYGFSLMASLGPIAFGLMFLTILTLGIAGSIYSDMKNGRW